jgi:hypothetical protein
MKRLCISSLLLSGLAASMYAQSSVPRRATMTGSQSADGKCTIEVNVDGVAEIEISDDRADLQTLSGSPASWVRFECTGGGLPRLPQDFKFKDVHGRGRQGLLRDPRGNRGVAVIRIEDPKDGSESYTADIEWRGFGSTGKGTFGRYDDNRNSRLGANDPATKRAIDACLDAVRQKADRDFAYRNLEFGKVELGDSPGQGDRVTGRFIFRRSQSADEFQFSCSMDLKNSKVRKVELRRW